jgi:hypothetical protein
LYENKLGKKRINLIDDSGPLLNRPILAVILQQDIQQAGALKMFIQTADMAVYQKRI